MQTTSRLDNVLNRNRKSAILDLVLVAFVVLGVLFTGLAFGEELPNLSSTPVTAETAPASQAAVAQNDAPAPVRVARR